MDVPSIKWGGERGIWLLWLVTNRQTAGLVHASLVMVGSLGLGIIFCTSPLPLERSMMCPEHSQDQCYGES